MDDTHHFDNFDGCSFSSNVGDNGDGDKSCESQHCEKQGHNSLLPSILGARNQSFLVDLGLEHGFFGSNRAFDCNLCPWNGVGAIIADLNGTAEHGHG